AAGDRSDPAHPRRCRRVRGASDPRRTHHEQDRRMRGGPRRSGRRRPCSVLRRPHPTIHDPRILRVRRRATKDLDGQGRPTSASASSPDGGCNKMISDTLRTFILSDVWLDGSPDELGNDTPLLERGILDSLGILNLVSFIEDEWGVTVEDEELIPEHFGTISRIAQLIESK